MRHLLVKQRIIYRNHKRNVLQIRIFTLPFDSGTESFPDEIISEFCSNKKVRWLKTEFFQRDGKPFWSVAVHYEVVLPPESGESRGLDDAEKLLYERLRLWRKEEAARHRLPPYMVARNSQLVEMVRQRCQTLESLKGIKGFGKKSIQKYGKQLIEIIKGFYEAGQASGQAVKPVASEGDTEVAASGDVPF